MKLIPKQRILPNGTKDEIRVSDNKFIKKVDIVAKIIYNITKMEGGGLWITTKDTMLL